MDQLLLLHRRLLPQTKAQAEALNASGMPLASLGADWNTCLRHISFLPQPGRDSSIHSGTELESQFKQWCEKNPTFSNCYELLQNEEAVSFLISVLCGLESPVLGETEVLGQFKNFMGSAVVTNFSQQNTQGVPEKNMKGELNKLLRIDSPLHQFVMSEVKFMRTQYVRHLGSNSYGSLLRKELKDVKNLAIIGSGQFVADIMPWFKEKSEINIWCRRPELGEAHLRNLKQVALHLRGASYDLSSLRPAETCEALIIAAPISDDKINIMLPNKIKLILDCRGEQELKTGTNTLCGKAARFMDLKSLTDLLKFENAERSEKVLELKSMIQERSRVYFDKPRIRPQGWDDLLG